MAVEAKVKKSNPKRNMAEQTRATPYGWTYVEQTTNLYLGCQMCRKKGRDMFYRSLRLPGAGMFTTEAICGACFWTRNNEPAGPPRQSEEKVAK
jgi:phage FluMu gp28-like protein